MSPISCNSIGDSALLSGAILYWRLHQRLHVAHEAFVRTRAVIVLPWQHQRVAMGTNESGPDCCFRRYTGELMEMKDYRWQLVFILVSGLEEGRRMRMRRSRSWRRKTEGPAGGLKYKWQAVLGALVPRPSQGDTNLQRQTLYNRAAMEWLCHLLPLTRAPHLKSWITLNNFISYVLSLIH